jgi:hypothetical protein
VVETIEAEASSNIVHVRIRSKLTKDDYEQFAPRIERLIREKGKSRLLVEMDHFHGWTPGALWEDVKFDLKHFGDVERLALVGDSRWEQWMASFCKPFTTAQIRYFDKAETEQARRWLASQ